MLEKDSTNGATWRRQYLEKIQSARYSTCNSWFCWCYF